MKDIITVFQSFPKELRYINLSELKQSLPLFEMTDPRHRPQDNQSQCARISSNSCQY